MSERRGQREEGERKSSGTGGRGVEREGTGLFLWKDGELGFLGLLAGAFLDEKRRWRERGRTGGGGWRAREEEWEMEMVSLKTMRWLVQWGDMRGAATCLQCGGEQAQTVNCCLTHGLCTPVDLAPGSTSSVCPLNTHRHTSDQTDISPPSKSWYYRELSGITEYCNCFVITEFLEWLLE